MKKKILITLNTYTNYQFDFYRSLKKFYSVKIFFLDEKSFNYKFKYLKKNDYFYQKQTSFKKLLLKENPDFVFFGGVKHAKLVNFNLNSISIKYFFWLERLKENFIRQKYYQIFYRRILSKASGILAVGNEAKLFYSKFNKITYNLQYCINISKYKINNDFKKNKINFLYVGQLIKRKGIDEFISAIKLLNKDENSQVNFTFVGEGPYKNKLIKIKKNYKNINIEKFQNRNKLNKYFNSHNVFVFPSIYDGWGVAPMEAMASGLYLIISNQCGVIRSNRLIKKFNTVINPNRSEILKGIKFCIKNKKIIISRGKKNQYIIKKSLLNADLNVKKLNAFLKNL